MSNRAAARKYRDVFDELAENPTPENQAAAQKLYEENFCQSPWFGNHKTEDFHMGEMYNTASLLKLKIRRHEKDCYLKVRGNFEVMI